VARAAQEAGVNQIRLGLLDQAILAAYFGVILLVGWRLRRRMSTTREFLQAGQGLPVWATGLAFMAANCGALEVMGMVSTSAKYGARANHFYWAGAVPAMVFLALFMMPIYKASRARSVPEFLKLRFGEGARTFNAVSFAILMVLVSGISLYAMAILFGAVLGWSFTFSIWVGAGIVLLYVVAGGLAATIYNEVLQFGLIVVGFLPLSLLALRDLGGWGGLRSRLDGTMAHTWKGLPAIDPASATMDGVGTVLGLGFVLSFGYWCTDFLLVQRALAAKDVDSAVRTPLVAAVPKLAFPFLVVVPGLAAAVLFPTELVARYDLALPELLLRYYGPGLLGLGVTAMMASFMSGMAGNVTAFNTVWTFDLYQGHIAPGKTDRHYLIVSKVATVAAVVLSVGTAYIVLRFNNLMDYVQLLFSFFNAPLFATFLLGMFTTWATPAGALAGLVVGTAAAAAHYLAYSAGLLSYGTEMTANFYGAIAGWAACFATTVAVSLFTARKPEAELAGLVYGRLGPLEAARRKPWLFAALILAGLVVLNVLFY
jgi:SSS family solute:Na+ symporter